MPYTGCCIVIMWGHKERVGSFIERDVTQLVLPRELLTVVRVSDSIPCRVNKKATRRYEISYYSTRQRSRRRPKFAALPPIHVSVKQRGAPATHRRLTTWEDRMRCAVWSASTRAVASQVTLRRHPWFEARSKKGHESRSPVAPTAPSSKSRHTIAAVTTVRAAAAVGGMDPQPQAAICARHGALRAPLASR